MLITPTVLTHLDFKGKRDFTNWLEALVKTNHVGSSETPEGRNDIAAYMEKINTERKEKDSEDLNDAAMERLSLVERDVGLARSATALLYGAVSATWTAFEIAAADMWIEAVNSRPRRLAKRLFATLPDQAHEGLTAKTVSVKLLIELEFDLSNSLGVLLAPAYDFGKVSGVAKAYESAFGLREQLKAVFESSELLNLQLLRNLIVHKAALVDAAFLGASKLAFPLNEKAPMDATFARVLIESAARGIAEIATAVDRWLVENPELESLK